MKRATVLLLALAMILPMVACKKSGEQTPAPAARDTWEQRTEKMTQEEVDQAPSADQLVTIETKLGSVQGVQKDGYREYRGLRYANAQRWQEAVAVTTPWTGVYDATKWGDRCMQFKGIYGFADSVINQFYDDESLVSFPAGYSEDALNLNIWTPDDAKDCPVLVYIHGGAFMTGSNTDPSTDGEAYADHGVVTVAINYRLGPWSNVYGDGYTGNLALKDQLTAIRWVKDNIADYGGDPSKITIMGESAGAMSVQNLLMTPLMEEGLISGAIMMSGGGYLGNDKPMSASTMDVIWQQVKLACGYNSISDMLGLSSKELFESWALNLGKLSSSAATPIMDGEALVERADQALANGHVQNVPTMIGMLSEDMTPYNLYKAAVNYAIGSAGAGNKPVYLYYFDRQQPGENKFGAFHAADLYYAFGTLYRNWRPFDEVDYRISHDMIDYITNFVKTGDPNGAGLATWEPATVESQQFMHFGDEEAAMMTPDKSFLNDNQYNKPSFPSADKIKYPGVEEPTGSDASFDLTNARTATKDDLVGTWNYVGLYKEGAWNTMKDKFVITDGTFTYGQYASSITFDGNVMNIIDWGCTMTCWFNPAGQLIIEDSRNMYYVCEDPANAPSEPSGGEVQFDLTNAKAAAKSDLVGTWNYIGLQKDGAWTKMADKFVITDGTFTYGQYASSITFDKNVMNIIDWGCTMTCWFNPAGQLIIEDSRNMYYVCEDPNGTASTPPEQPAASDEFDLTNAKTAAKNDLIGTWDYVGLKAGGAWTKQADKFVIAERTFTSGQYASSITFDKNVMKVIDWGC
ncbi:MAG: carboxylesterase family protein, partial [Oscillospiraceae bacterium]|nr:carboxylesterase family protein [Oscillospiraceae bacterium]